MKNSRKTALLLTVGATLPTTADQLITNEPIIVNPQRDNEEYDVITSKLGASKRTFIDTNKNTLNQSITHTMIASNADGTALDTLPQYADLLKVAGFEEVVDTATVGQETVTYKNTQNPQRGSAIIYQDGHKYTATDSVVASVTIEGQAGRKCMISSTIQAYLDNGGIPVVEANPTLPEKDTTNQVGFTTVDVITFAGTTVTADAFRFNMNPNIANLYATGAKQYDITDYKPTLEIDFFTTNANYVTALTDIDARNVKEVIIKTNQDVNGNMVSGKSVQIKASRAVPSNINDGDSEDRIKRTLTFDLGLDASDFAVEITHGYFA